MSSAKKRVLDLSDVKEVSGSGINPRRMPEGEYLAKVVDVQEKESAKDGQPMWLFILELVDHRGACYPYYCKLQANQLWKVRNLFLSAGVDLPKAKVSVNPNKVVGKQLIVLLEDDEYQGRQKSNIAGVYPVPSGPIEGPEASDEDLEFEDLEEL